VLHQISNCKKDIEKVRSIDVRSLQEET